jgi:putative FmdB family regulatory protein
MPIYEYVCVDCHNKFDARRSFSQADDPLPCPECGGDHIRRLLSTFFALSSSGSATTTVAGTGGGCSACASHACSTCGIGHN